MSDFLGSIPSATTITRTWTNVEAGDFVGPFSVPSHLVIERQKWRLVSGTATALENPELGSSATWTSGEGESKLSGIGSYIDEVTPVVMSIPGKQMWAMPNPDAGSDNTVTVILIVAYRAGTAG